MSDIGPLGEWGLTVENDEIVVNSQMETGRRGVYASGDVTTYAGKLKLIATGFAESATAVNQAVHFIYPEKKVNPRSLVQPRGIWPEGRIGFAERGRCVRQR